MQPLIVVNFKTYATAMGKKQWNWHKQWNAHRETMSEWLQSFPLLTCMRSRKQHHRLEVWSQHLDPVGQGSFTGWLQPENAIERGAQGTIINHAEHKVNIDHVQRLMEQLPDEFPMCACAADVEEAHRLAELGPTFIAVEPPELIGGDISVTTADPAIVSDTVNAVRNINPDVRVLCGAGVKDGKDVKTAVELGAHGVLLASGVTKASDLDAVLADLVSGLEN